MKKPKGLQKHRFKDHPEERRFAAAWADQQEHHRNLDHLLEPADGSGHQPKAADRDYVVAATVIQWLGSPVGQGFLSELGYSKAPCFEKPATVRRLVAKGLASSDTVTLALARLVSKMLPEEP